MKTNCFIETSRLLLRPFLMEDKEALFDIVSDAETCSHDGGYPPYESMNDHFMNLCSVFSTQKGRYSIILKETGLFIGMAHLMQEDRAVSCQEIGYVLEKNHRRNGYAYEMACAMIKKLFEEAQVEIITASIFEFNEGSRALLDKLGFLKEGITHKALNHSLYGPMDLIDFYLPREVWKNKTLTF